MCRRKTSRQNKYRPISSVFQKTVIRLAQQGPQVAGSAADAMRLRALSREALPQGANTRLARLPMPAKGADADPALGSADDGRAASFPLNQECVCFDYGGIMKCR